MTRGFPRDAVAAVSHADPYPYYAYLVAERPLYYDDSLASWVASSADAVTAVLSSDHCGVRPATDPVPRPLIGSEAGEAFRHFIRMNDRDGRRGLKRELARAIASVEVARVIAISERHARSLLVSGGMASMFTFQLPAFVIGELLGFPDDQLSCVSQLIDDFVRCLAPGAVAATIERGKIAAGRLSTLVRSLLNDVDVHSSDSLLAAIKRELKPATTEEIDVAVANAIGFLFQGYEATAGLVGNGVVALAVHREFRETIAADHSLLRSFVEEVIRFDSPVQNTRRYVTKSGEIAGRSFSAGDVILVVLAAANRDPRANANPERFDVHRVDRRAFTFGIGAHACPGADLATTIAMEGIECAMRVPDGPARPTRAVRYHPSPNVRIPIFA